MKKNSLTLAEKGDIRETLAFEEIRESRGQVTAETVPLEAKLLLRVHNAAPRADPVTFDATPVAAALHYGIPLSIAPVPDCSSSCKIRKENKGQNAGVTIQVVQVCGHISGQCQGSDRFDRWARRLYSGSSQ